MNYTQAFAIVCDDIDSYYEQNYNKAYFFFKSGMSYQLTTISIKAFFGKLDEYKFNRYLPYDFLREDVEQESHLDLSIRKICCAIRILNLLILLPKLHPLTVKSLNIDINPSLLYKLHDELPKNFNMLREHLNELLIRFHPDMSSEKDKESITVVRRNMTSPIVVRSAQARIGSSNPHITIDIVRGNGLEELPNAIETQYEYEDVVGETSCCFSCSFSFFSRKKKEKEPLVDSVKQTKYN